MLDLSDRGRRRGRRRRMARDRRRRRRRFVLLAFVVLGVSGAGAAWAADADVLAGRSDDAHRPRPTPHHALHAGRSGPVEGALLIADRGNDRILLVSPAHRVLWRFPT